MFVCETGCDVDCVTGFMDAREHSDSKTVTNQIWDGLGNSSFDISKAMIGRIGLIA